VSIYAEGIACVLCGVKHVDRPDSCEALKAIQERHRAIVLLAARAQEILDKFSKADLDEIEAHYGMENRK